MELEGDDAFAKVYSQLTGETPAAIGKLGTIETELAYFRFKTRKAANPIQIHPQMIQTLCRNAGMFPPTQATAEKMADELLRSLLQLDSVPIWWIKEQSRELFGVFARAASYVSLQSLECFLSPNPEHWWTAKKARVLVISPFTESIQAQVPHLDKVWAQRPGFWSSESTFTMLKFPLSFGVQDSSVQSYMIQTWTNSVGLIQDFQKKMDAIDYDIALIGVGIHSLPLVAYAKQKGKKAIHLGGATQLFFGVRGGRWDTMKEFQPLFNEHWIRPSVEERPVHFEQVEKGCYW